MVRSLVVVAVFAAAACTTEPAALFVDLRTDLEPGREFVRAVLVLDPDGEAEERVTAARPGEGWLSGIRVLELEGMDPGDFVFDTRLEDASGAIRLQRRVRVSLDGRQAITVVLSRDCIDTYCGDEEGVLGACIAGACVDPGCFGENLEACGIAPTCTRDEECSGASACAVPTCRDGLCLVGVDPSVCESAQVCDADLGCADRSAGVVPRIAQQRSIGVGGAGARGVAVDGSGNIYAVGGVYPPADFGGGEIAGEDADPFIVSYDPALDHRWSRTFAGVGGADGHESGATSVAVGPSGDLFVAGVTGGATDFGAGPIGPGGGDGLDYGFVASLTADGASRWAKVIGDADGRAFLRDVHVGASGRVFATGHIFDGAVTVGSDVHTPVMGGRDLLLLALDEVGGMPEYQWSRVFGGVEGDEGWALGAGPGGTLLFTGFVAGDADLGGGPGAQDAGSHLFLGHFDDDAVDLGSWRPGIDYGFLLGYDVAADALGNVYIVGTYKDAVTIGDETVSSRGSYDALVVSLAPDRSVRWVRSFGGVYADQAHGVVVGPAGNVWIAGQFEGVAEFGGGPLYARAGSDIFVAALDRSGGHVFSMGLGSEREDRAFDLAVTPSGTVIVVGEHGVGFDGLGGSLPDFRSGIVMEFEPAGPPS